VRTLEHTAPVVFARFGDDGREIVTAAGHEVRLWTAGGRLIRTVPVAGHIRLAHVSPDGRTILIGGDHAVELRDATTGRLLVRLPLRGRVIAAALDLDGAYVAAADGRGTVEVWSSDGNRLWSRGNAGCSALAFSPDGKTLGAACGSEGRLWDSSSGRLLDVLAGRVPSKPLTGLVFSPDGRSVLTTNTTGGANTWDTRTGARLHALVGQFGRIASSAFSPDGRWILTGGPIAAILWSSDTGRLVFYLRGHQGLVTSVSFGPDSRSVLTSSLDGTVRTYVCQVCGGLPQLERIARERLQPAGR
jgi:WD40 repeat protein